MKFTRLAAITAAAAFTTGAVTVATGVVQGEGGGVSVGFIERVDAGRLEIATDPDQSLTVTRFDADGDLLGAPIEIRLRNRDKCEVDTAALAQLISFETIGFVDLGLVSNGLGSRTSNNCGSANGRLGDGESLRLSLGTDFDGSGILIDRAELDIEGKFDSDLTVTADVPLFDGAGAAITGPVPLSSASDNGNDSGPSDNVTIEVFTSADADASSVTISPSTSDGRGEISLEGGGDYPVPADHRTVLWLTQENTFEYDFDCGDVETETAEDLGAPTAPGIDADSPRQVTIVRYDDDGAGPTDICLPIGADLSADDLGVLLRKTTADASGDEQTPQIRIELIWAVRQDSASLADDLEREIDLDGDGTLFDFEPATPCLSYAPQTPPASGPFGVVDDDGDGLDGFLDPDYPGFAAHPLDGRFPSGELPWCLIVDERTPSTIDGVPVILQRQVWDGRGDPRWI
jgi:hypothetical protein